MGPATLTLGVIAVVLTVSFTEAGGSCPLPSKVYSCSPECVQDYECSNGKVCCTNSCNAKSCVVANAHGTAGSSSTSNHGSGVYCDNVKCNTGEICKMDRITQRNKCNRA